MYREGYVFGEEVFGGDDIIATRRLKNSVTLTLLVALILCFIRLYSGWHIDCPTCLSAIDISWGASSP